MRTVSFGAYRGSSGRRRRFLLPSNLLVAAITAASTVVAQPRATASAGVPKVESNDLRLEANVGLGYSWPTASVWADGGGRVFDLAQAGREQTEADTRFDAQGSYSLEVSRAVGVHFGAAAGFAQYSTDSTFYSPFASTEEASQMVRVSGLSGLSWRPSPRLVARGVVGAGWQREAYLRTAVDGSGALSDSDRQSSTVRYLVTAEAEWIASPNILSLAIRSGLEGFGIARSEALFTYSPGLGFAQQAEVASAHRIDARARLEAAVLAAEWIGIAPFLYAELMYVRMATGRSDVAVLVPSGGVGLGTPLL